MEPEVQNILFTQKQGMGQFAMTTYYNLLMHIPNQEAAQKTLESIDDVRKMFLDQTSINWKSQVGELLSVRYNKLMAMYKDADEGIKPAIRKEALAIREIHDALSNIMVGEYPENGQGNKSVIEQAE